MNDPQPMRDIRLIGDMMMDDPDPQKGTRLQETIDQVHDRVLRSLCAERGITWYDDKPVTLTFDRLRELGARKRNRT